MRYVVSKFSRLRRSIISASNHTLHLVSVSAVVSLDGHTVVLWYTTLCSYANHSCDNTCHSNLSHYIAIARVVRLTLLS